MPENLTEPRQRQAWPSIGWRWLVWLLFAASWTVALLIPNPVSAVDNDFLAYALRFFAKGLHVVSYAILTILSGWLHLPGRWRWLVLVLVSAHGFATEYFQQFVRTRTGSLQDVAIDHGGILLGILVTHKWWFRREPAADTAPAVVESTERSL